MSTDLPAVLRAGLLDPAARTALDWQPFRPGVEAHWLHRSPDGGPAAALLRYAPGSEVPRHALDGRQSDDAGTYETGTLVVNAPGTEHKVRSDTGCTALLIWERAPRLYEGT
jgi:anti-sigma factor ChrR (cupin superfamily)